MTLLPQIKDPSPPETPTGYSPVLYNIQKDIGIRRENGAAKLQKLKPIHKQIIAMHLSGIPATEISAVLNLKYGNVHRVLNDPLAKAFITDFDDMTRKEFDALRFKANAAIRAGLDGNDIHTRLRSADLFSKRAGDYHPKLVESQETAEDVIKRILALNIQVNVSTGESK